jgi:hypothetical protein
MRTLLCLFLALSAGTAAAESFDRQVNADPHGRVEVSNIAGHVEVSGWDKPQVAVHATLNGSSLKVEVTSEQGRTVVRVVHGDGGGWWGGGGDADLHVQVPRGSDLGVSAVSAEVTSSAMQGPQRLQTVSGGIEAQIGPASVEAKTVSGSIRLTGAGEPATIRVNSVSGSVTVERAAGSLEATTVSGRLEIALSPARALRVHTTSGELDFSGRLERNAVVEVQTISGALRLKAAPDPGYEYEVSTFSGAIEDCFGQEPQRTSQYGPGWRLAGTRGSGRDAQLRARTLSGSVSLCER